MDDQNVPDFLKIRQMLASNQPPPLGQPFEQMPSPLDRGPSEDEPQDVAPKQQPKPEPDSLGSDLQNAADMDGPDAQSSADAPNAPAKTDPLASLRVTKEDLDNAHSAKRRDLAMGMIADALTNRQGVGNFYLGRMNPHNNVQGYFQKMADMEDQPIEQKQTLMKQALAQPGQDMQAQAADPNSGISKAVSAATVAVMRKSGLPTDGVEGMSALQTNEFLDKNPVIKEAVTQDNAMKRLTGVLAQQSIANSFKERTADRGDQRLALAGNAQQMSAGKQYANEMGDAENQLLAANKAISIIDKVSAKELQSTPQLRSDLAATLSSMMAGGKPATVYGMSHQDFDSVYGRAQKEYQFLTGSTGDSMTEAQLNQLKKDVHALQGEYQQQRKIRYDALKQSMPESVQPKLDKRFDTFTQGATGSQMDPDYKAALQHVKDNPNDPDNPAILLKIHKKYGNAGLDGVR